MISTLVLTAGFSGRDPHCMMHVYGLRKGPARSAEGASKRGRVSTAATCCQRSLSLLLLNLPSTCSKASGPMRISPLNG